MTDIYNFLKNGLSEYNSNKLAINIVGKLIVILLKNVPKNFNNNEKMDYFYKLFGKLKFHKSKFKNNTSKLAKTKFKVISNMLIVLMEANLDFDKLLKISTVEEKLTKLSKKLKIKVIKFINKIKNKVIDLFESEIASGLVNFLIKLSKILLKGLKGLIVGQILNKIIRKKENVKKVRKIKKKAKNKVIKEDINKDYNEFKIVNNSIKAENNIQNINRHLENLIKNDINNNIINDNIRNNDKITIFDKELETEKKVSDKNPNITENLKQTSCNLNFVINEFSNIVENISRKNLNNKKECNKITESIKNINIINEDSAFDYFNDIYNASKQINNDNNIEISQKTGQ